MKYEDALEILTVSSAAVNNGSCLMQQAANEMEKCRAGKDSVLSVALKLMTDICCGFAILNKHNGKQVIILYNLMHKLN